MTLHTTKTMDLEVSSPRINVFKVGLYKMQNFLLFIIHVQYCYSTYTVISVSFVTIVLFCIVQYMKPSALCTVYSI